MKPFNVVTTYLSGRQERRRPKGSGHGWGVALGGWRGVLALVVAGLLGSFLTAQATDTKWVTFSNSVVSVPVAVAASPGVTAVTSAVRTRAEVTRTNLTADEVAAPLGFEVALKMRNLAELQARVNRGEIISPAEMAEKYYPTAEDYAATRAWITGQGMAVTRDSPSRLAVFASGTVGQIQKAMQVNFARVTAVDGKEYTSAVSAPSVPTDIATALVGINGLQPFIRMHKHLVTAATSSAITPPYLAAPVAQAYDASGLKLTGAGQIIAIIIDSEPKQSDVVAFWKKCSVTQSWSNITLINVLNGPLFPPSGEETLDVEWSSSMAPAAKVRVYAVGELLSANIDAAFDRILVDVTNAAYAGMHQLSMSFGDTESDTGDSQMQTDDQYFVSLASAGITAFASSGDGGSRPSFPPDGSTVYSKHAAVAAENPASDPNVTAVGGTNLKLNTSTGNNVTSETAWSVEGNGSSGATGGGASMFFGRPSWQMGTGVPNGNPAAAGLGSDGPMRLVPDVAAIADVATPVLFILDGESQPVAGTSVASPMWAGFCALMNEARTQNNQAPLGLLGPRIYPLLGSSNFRDITSGSNGDYSAGVGYDMCTGVGAPNVANLVEALTNVANITVPPENQTVNVGQNATFTVAANATTALTYQWQREANGASVWSSLSDDGTYAGTATPTLTVTGVTAAMSGDQFQCVVSNTFQASATSSSALLMVNVPLSFTTYAGLTGNAGSTDSAGGSPQFNGPKGIAMDSAGNIYVADAANDVIREISANGSVTTLAGLAGNPGSTDGAGSGARFNNPTAVAVDGAFNVYVADTSNDVIRKITPAGNVTTLAGKAGMVGTANTANKSSALFNGPTGIVVNSAGSVIYVSDTNNHTIRRITSSGAVTTVAGLAGFSGNADGIDNNAEFGSPAGLAMDSAGDVYIADTAYHTIREMTYDGFAYSVSTVAGTSGTAGSADGLGTAAQFNQPAGVAVDGAGNLYVADTHNDTVREISPTGIVTTPAGLAGNVGSADGVGAAAQFNQPVGVAVDSAGDVFVADSKNDTLREGSANPAPQIQIQPQPQKVVIGSSASFTVKAGGNPAPGYQWQALATGAGANWGNLSDGGNYTGTGTATLTVNATTTVLSGYQYRCVAINTAGTATSNAAALTVIVPLTFGTQPGAQNVKAGAKVTFSVSATAASKLTYQWQENGVNIMGATNATLVLKAVTMASDGAYSVVVTSALGSLTSSSAMLVVAKVVPKITVQPTPASFSTMAGNTVVYSITATGDPTLTYAWQKGTKNLVNGTNISGVNTPTLTLTNVTAGTTGTGGSYRVIVSNPAGKATSKAVKLVVTAVTTVK